MCAPACRLLKKPMNEIKSRLCYDHLHEILDQYIYIYIHVNVVHSEGRNDCRKSSSS